MEVEIKEDKILIIKDVGQEIFIGAPDGGRFKKLSDAIKLIEAKQMLLTDSDKGGKDED